MKNTSFYSTCSNCTTSCDREYVLYRHKERFVCSTLWCWDPCVNSVHEFHDLVSPWASRIFKSFKSRSLDNRNVISWEVILGKKFTNFHLNQFKKFVIIYHITFVHEYNDVRNTNLTSKKNVLFCLSHNTICSSNYEDSTIHLSCTCDHVLNVVSMSWAVNVCIMSMLCLILNMCCRNCDTTLSFFWSFIDIFEVFNCVSWNSFSQNFCDSCC